MSDLFLEIKSDFEKIENPELVEKMKKYMRGQFQYYGIYTPDRNKIFKKYKNEISNLEWVSVKNLVNKMWNQPQREFQLFAQDILDLFPGSYEKGDWKFLEKLILDKSWWDTVDFLSSHQYRDYSLLYEKESLMVVDRWLGSDNIWLQRTCLLYQLWAKENMNIEVLEKSISRLRESDEFFIQKAIGWILREYSKTNSKWVRDFIENNDLKPLSVREGSKYL